MLLPLYAKFGRYRAFYTHRAESERELTKTTREIHGTFDHATSLIICAPIKEFRTPDYFQCGIDSRGVHSMHRQCN